MLFGALVLAALVGTATFSAGVARAASTCTSSSLTSVRSNFNGTPIAAGHVIWFNAVFKVSGLPSSGATIYFENQSITGVPGVAGGTVTPPNSYITFSPTASSASTTFDTTQNAWITTIPVSAGANYLAAAVPVVDTNGTGGSGSPTWSGTFVTSTSSIGIQWQWAAATYNSGFPATPSTYNSIGVTSVDGQVSGDHAGTPENEKALKDSGGATGGGGSNFTGSYSGTASFTPCAPTPPTVNLGYADSYPPRGAQPNFPSPWKGSASVFDPSQTVLFIGCGYGAPDNCPTFTSPTTGITSDWYDDGAIRLDNPKTGVPLSFTGTGSNVTIGYCVYTPWNGLTGTANPGQTLILSQTGGTEPCGPQVQAKTGFNVVPLNFPLNENLDTSESYAQSANYLNYIQGGPPVCSNDGLIPVATLQLNGAAATITDNAQTLNDGGVDLGGLICGVQFTGNSTNGSNVLTHVQTPQGGTTGLVVGTAVNGAGFPNGFTIGNAITAVNASADTITLSVAANATQGGLIEQQLFSETHQWSTAGVSGSGLPAADLAAAARAGTATHHRVAAHAPAAGRARHRHPRVATAARHARRGHHRQRRHALKRSPRHTR